ncbi:MAG: GatB/YqeY domain-containing protein [Desulfobacteraceae bacterium]|nr:GatB/YqeY domain-containing protein [Desulfobacteraceae bacterium]
MRKKADKSSSYLEIIESYLPKLASEDDIRKWIAGNIDFAQFKNKMQAMGSIMKHFGSLADGNTVKSILSSL